MRARPESRPQLRPQTLPRARIAPDLTGSLALLTALHTARGSLPRGSVPPAAPAYPTRRLLRYREVTCDRVIEAGWLQPVAFPARSQHQPLTLTNRARSFGWSELAIRACGRPRRGPVAAGPPGALSWLPRCASAHPPGPLLLPSPRYLAHSTESLPKAALEASTATCSLA